MALKSTVFKASLQIADMDRGLYATHALTLARHPSETDERLMVRLLAFALQVPADDHDGALVFARGLSDADEPDLWQHSLDGQLRALDRGRPARRTPPDARPAAAPTASRSTATATRRRSGGPASQGKLARLTNLAVWQLPSAQSQALAALAATVDAAAGDRAGRRHLGRQRQRQRRHRAGGAESTLPANKHEHTDAA